MQDVNNHLMQTDAEKRREMQTCTLALFEFKSGPNLGCMSVPIGQSLHSYFRKICTNAVNRVELGRENTIDAMFSSSYFFGDCVLFDQSELSRWWRLLIVWDVIFIGVTSRWRNTRRAIFLSRVFEIWAPSCGSDLFYMFCVIGMGCWSLLTCIDFFPEWIRHLKVD